MEPAYRQNIRSRDGTGRNLDRSCRKKTQTEGAGIRNQPPDRSSAIERRFEKLGGATEAAGISRRLQT